MEEYWNYIKQKILPRLNGEDGNELASALQWVFQCGVNLACCSWKPCQCVTCGSQYRLSFPNIYPTESLYLCSVACISRTKTTFQIPPITVKVPSPRSSFRLQPFPQRNPPPDFGPSQNSGKKEITFFSMKFFQSERTGKCSQCHKPAVLVQHCRGVRYPCGFVVHSYCIHCLSEDSTECRKCVDYSKCYRLKRICQKCGVAVKKFEVCTGYFDEKREYKVHCYCRKCARPTCDLCAFAVRTQNLSHKRLK